MGTKIKEMWIILILFFSLLLLVLSITTAERVVGIDNTRQNGAPKIDFMSPKGSEIPIEAKIEVTFSEKMQQSETEQAFTIIPETEGVFSWDNKSLTFTPEPSLVHGEPYQVIISTAAKNLVGENLDREYHWNFTTVENEKNGGEEEDNNLGWDFLEPIVTGATIIATAIVAAIGFYKLRKKRSQLRKYIDKLDKTYNRYKYDPRLCERNLRSLKESLKAKVKRGEVEEYHYIILDKKIDDYLEEFKTKKTSSKPRIVKIIDEEQKPKEPNPPKGPYKSSDESEELDISKEYKQSNAPRPRIIDDSADEDK